MSRPRTPIGTFGDISFEAAGNVVRAPKRASSQSAVERWLFLVDVVPVAVRHHCDAETCPVLGGNDFLTVNLGLLPLIFATINSHPANEVSHVYPSSVVRSVAVLMFRSVADGGSSASQTLA